MAQASRSLSITWLAGVSSSDQMGTAAKIGELWPLILSWFYPNGCASRSTGSRPLLFYSKLRRPRRQILIKSSTWISRKRQPTERPIERIEICWRYAFFSGRFHRPRTRGPNECTVTSSFDICLKNVIRSAAKQLPLFPPSPHSEQESPLSTWPMKMSEMFQ